MSQGQQVRFDFSIKIILLGDRNVGKSSFLTRLSECTAHTDHKDHKEPITCLNFSPRSHVDLAVMRRGKRVRIRIVGTGGQERFRSITASYYRGAQGCLLMFDADNTTSFMNIPKWHTELEVYTNHHPITTFLVGSNSNPNQRQVSATQAEKLATELGLQYHALSPLGKSSQGGVDVIEAMMDKVLLNVSRLPSVTLDAIPVTVQVTPVTEEKPHKFHCAC